MLNENIVEQSFIDQLINQGYSYYNGTDISPISDNPQRESFNSVILEEHFKKSLKKLNPTLPATALNEAYQKVINLGTEDIMENNERFHTLLTNGVTVEYTKEGREKGINVHLLDAENIENNSFWVVNQLVVKENNNEKRFDVVIFINGLPLVFIELKSASDEKATLRKAYTQIQNYKKAVPSIFYYNSICVISDGIDATTSSVSAPFSRFLSWRTPEKIAGEVRTELQILTEYMLNKKTLVELIRYCTVFEQEEKKDAKTGLIFQVKIKKVAAYHQYYAVQKAVAQTLRATNDKEGDRKIGVVWHTQGSGKSLSMVFYSGQIITHPQMGNPTIVILTDRNDLDEQLFGTFGNCVGLLRQTPKQANSRAHLKKLLNVSGGGVIFTTIQKFSPEQGNVFDTLSNRTNIIVVADEAHRTQYGFAGREVDVKDENENIIGSEIKYGNAKYLRDALPNASYIGFTGTPIEKQDKSTPAVFGDYIDVYDIKQAVDDGATVPISYESRLIKIKLDEETSKKLDDEVNNISDATEEQIEKAKQKTATINAVVGHPDRLKDVAKDIVSHFEARQTVFDGKAMIVGMTRDICVRLYNEIIALKPEWHKEDLDKGTIKVIMTSTSDDAELFQPHHTTKQQRKELAVRMKDANDDLKLVIVRDMWLTGFDAPSLHTMYIDKKMQGANLMQAIARVNRVYKDKPGGLVVDYIGIGQDLRNAMATYIQGGGQGLPVVDIKEAIAGMLEKFEVVEQMFNGFNFKEYFKVETAKKLQILLGAQNFILSDIKLKERFLKEVNILSKLFAMSIPSPEANKIKDGVAFFQAVKARINKFIGGGVKSDFEVETAIKQIVDEALSSGGVIDIFEAAGISKPSVSILSDDFLLEVKNMPQKNIAFELLKKLLSDEVSVRKSKNIAQGKKFSEMLESVVKRYHNNQIDSAQVLAELSEIAKEMRLDDHKSEELGLTSAEYAFYTVLKENKSTSFLEDSKMKELIHTIVDVIRKNATVDWSKRDDVRAKLRLTVKKILMRYGYPPDLARLEADKVLAQGESLAEIFTKGEILSV
ncbi:type I restriction endonuclease subunit R [Tenacibaculum finnmarkense]|uniref:type I restriction endonuclease subunit R n=1 Tax=Tenacibaculum finnmarkense TaxID=2781243 RepID=UPI001E5D8A67|nr:type I restriction endonuclease subunit R [Tenacibaculum finnmarkense]MCD8448016.1 type I restriction endonuclease subunit R [Tenacibaculum finnmarkense genomovar finnmarkense]